MKHLALPNFLIVATIMGLTMAAFTRTQKKVVNLQKDRQRYYAQVDDITKERAPIVNKKASKKSLKR